ncbi:MAG: beta-lactamase family protein [Planctomycetes bacterium]|nr:beta-lactamase family protein [Planctomycetota bacterium]
MSGTGGEDDTVHSVDAHAGGDEDAPRRATFGRHARHVPGLAATLVRRGEPARLLVTGHADRDARRPVTTDTVFAWWSLTKIVTATLALRLAERGRLDLDAPARERVPELDLVAGPRAGRRPRARDRGGIARGAREPSARDLLGHGAGFVDAQRHVARWFCAPDAPFPGPRAFLAEQLHRHGPLRASPGARLHYSNLGYATLGELLADAGARDFRGLVREQVLDPLGMTSTGFEAARLAHGDGSRLACGYVRRFSRLGLAVRLLDRRGFLAARSGGLRRLRWRDLVFSPHGGLLGSIDDLARFLRLFVEGGQSNGVRVLGRASLDAMATLTLRDPRRRATPSGTGLGWFVDERPRVAGARGVLLLHGGRGPGFTTEMAVLPAHGLAVGVLGNTEFDARSTARTLLADALAGRL